MSFNQRLKLSRQSTKLTQKQVADWCDIGIRYVKSIESGEEIPSEQTYHAFLNCIYGVGKPVPKTKVNGKKKNIEDVEEINE